MTWEDDLLWQDERLRNIEMTWEKGMKSIEKNRKLADHNLKLLDHTLRLIEQYLSELEANRNRGSIGEDEYLSLKKTALQMREEKYEERRLNYVLKEELDGQKGEYEKEKNKMEKMRQRIK